MVILRCCWLAFLLLISAGAQPPAPKAPAQNKQPPKPATPPKKETLGQWLLRITGISVTPNNLKGDETILTGDIWIVDLTTRSSQRLTRTGEYRSPVFLPDEMHLLALKGEAVVKLSLDGGAEEIIAPLNGAEKLVGVSQADGAEVLFVAKDKEQFTVGLLAWQTKQVTMLDYDKMADATWLAHLRGWERVYKDGRKVFTKTETKEGTNGMMEGSEVYYQQDKQPAENLSRCDGAHCGQPSLSAQARYVAYIKK